MRDVTPLHQDLGASGETRTAHLSHFPWRRLGFIVYAGVRSSADADALTAERPTLRPVLLDVVDLDQVRTA